MVALSVTAIGDGGHGGDMDGGWKLTAPAIGVARASKNARGERGNEEELTAESTVVLASSGRG